MKFSDDELVASVPLGNVRAVSRLISLAENGSPRSRSIIARIQAARGGDVSCLPQVIGVTGSPGAGKSTLVDQLAHLLSNQGRRVAIIAVDPSSPFSGGAILGDRIRMVKSTEHASVFVRSMATRGALGGISRATIDAVHILELAAFDTIIIETVGVGQAEIDIVRTADTVLVVLVPGMGDSVQAFKAGILEIADVFVVNKADREGADLLVRDLKLLLSVAEKPAGTGASQSTSTHDWEVPIIKTVATSGQGSEEVLREAERHHTWLGISPQGRARRVTILRETIRKLAAELLIDRYVTPQEAKLAALAQSVFDRKIDIRAAAAQLIEEKIPG